MRPDPALGVFDTMLAREGRVQALGPHLDRLSASLRTLYEHELCADLAATVMARAAELSEPHRLRVDAVPGDGELVVTVNSTPVPSGVSDPVTLDRLDMPGGLGAHKWIDRRLLSARQNVLLIDGEHVLEGAWGNVWLLEGDRVVTPADDGRILPGVTRALLLALAPSLGLEAREEPITLTRTTRAEAVFLTSAVRHAVPAGLDATAAEHPRVGVIRDALAALGWPAC